MGGAGRVGSVTAGGSITVSLRGAQRHCEERSGEAIPCPGSRVERLPPLRHEISHTLNHPPGQPVGRRIFTQVMTLVRIDQALVTDFQDGGFDIAQTETSGLQVDVAHQFRAGRRPQRPIEEIRLGTRFLSRRPVSMVTPSGLMTPAVSGRGGRVRDRARLDRRLVLCRDAGGGTGCAALRRPDFASPAAGQTPRQLIRIHANVAHQFATCRQIAR